MHFSKALALVCLLLLTSGGEVRADRLPSRNGGDQRLIRASTQPRLGVAGEFIEFRGRPKLHLGAAMLASFHLQRIRADAKRAFSAYRDGGFQQKDEAPLRSAVLDWKEAHALIEGVMQLYQGLRPSEVILKRENLLERLSDSHQMSPEFRKVRELYFRLVILTGLYPDIKKGSKRASNNPVVSFLLSDPMLEARSILNRNGVEDETFFKGLLLRFEDREAIWRHYARLENECHRALD